jgi:glycopeptide antibiotics resistance protein
VPVRGRTIAAWLLGLYALGLLVVLLAPTGDVPGYLLTRAASAAYRMGAPESWLAPERFEFVANVLVVVPAAGLASIVWPRLRWTQWTAYGFVASFSVETLQALVILDRSATFSDVVANTLGGLIGAALVAVVRRMRVRADA